MSNNARAPDGRRDQRLDILVDLRPARDGEGLLAEATVTIVGQLFIRGVRVMDGAGGPSVAMPQIRTEDGGCRDACFPPSTRTRKAIDRAVLDEYRRSLAVAGGVNRVEDGTETGTVTADGSHTFHEATEDAGCSDGVEDGQTGDGTDHETRRPQEHRDSTKRR